MRYTSCLDIERQARQAVSTAEKRRDDISQHLSLCLPHFPRPFEMH